MKKKAAKVYEYKIEWVEITPQLKKKLFSTTLPRKEYNEMSVASGYSSEYFRQLFLKAPDRLNKPVYDAIVAHLGKKNGKSTNTANVSVKDLNVPTKGKFKPITDAPPKSNYTVNTLKDRADNIRKLKNK